MRRSRWSLIVAGALLASASACSALTAGPGSVTLRVVMADDWAAAPAVEDAIQAFEAENPGVSVVVDAAPFSQIPEVVGAAIDLEEPYDVGHWHAFAAAAAGIAEPLDDLWVDADLTAGEYLPGAVEGVTWRGQRFGVPLDTNALVLLVNDAALREALGTTPSMTTLEDFRRTVEGLSPTDDRFALAVSSSSWTAYGWIVAHGGSLVAIDEAGEPTFTFEDPATREALQLLADLVTGGHAPRPFAPDLASDAVQAFSSGDHLMHASGSWDLPRTWRAPATTIPASDVSVRPLPQADPEDPRTVLGGSSLFVPVGSAHPELAFELMLHLTADDVALRLVQEEGRLPARTRLLDDQVFATSDDLAAFVAQLEHAEVMQLIAFPDVAGAFREGLEAILSERQTVDEAMADVQRYAEASREEGGG